MVVAVLIDGEHDTEGLYVVVPVLIDGEHNNEGFMWLLQS